MPKKIDSMVKERCVRQVLDHLAEYPTLEEDNEILRRASIFFAGALDPRNR